MMLLLALTRVASAQPFSLDTTFNPTYAFVDASNKNYTGFISDLYEENDGSIMLAGGFTDLPSSDRTSWVRLLDNGQLDYSWNPPSGANSLGSVQKVGNSYLFWRFSEVIATTLTGNFSKDYSLPIDSAFNCGSVGSPYVFKDGSFLAGIGGCAYPHPGNVQRVINFMRVGTDGYVDTSFHHNTNSTVGWTYPYDSTRILGYGFWVTEYDQYPVNRLFRIFKNGELDTTLSIHPGIKNLGFVLHVQDDGKMIIGANQTIFPGRSDTLSLYRLHADGSFDSTFNYQTNSRMSTGWPRGFSSVCPTTDGGFLIGGSFEQYDGYPRGNVVKTDGDGWIDSRYFNGSGIDSVKQRDAIDFPVSLSNIRKGQNDTYYLFGKFLMFDDQPVKPIIRLLGLSHTVSVEEEAIPNFLTVFPNPSDGQLTFSLNQNRFGRPWEIRLFDLQGRLLDSREVSSSISEQSINLVEYTGIMIYEVEMDQEVQRGRVVLR